MGTLPIFGKVDMKMDTMTCMNDTWRRSIGVYQLVDQPLTPIVLKQVFVLSPIRKDKTPLETPASLPDCCHYCGPHSRAATRQN